MAPSGIIQHILTAIVFLSTLHASESFKCYVCNSVYHAKCDSPPALDYLVECTDTTAQPTKSLMTQRSDLEPPPDSLRNYTFCRKTVASIPRQDNKVVIREAETRVVRSCGWLDPDAKANCKWGATDGVHREMCTCQKDSCNAATQIKLALLPAMVVLLIIYRTI